jgi:hypothetical protein
MILPENLVIFALQSSGGALQNRLVHGGRQRAEAAANARVSTAGELTRETANCSPVRIFFEHRNFSRQTPNPLPGGAVLASF